MPDSTDRINWLFPGYYQGPAPGESTKKPAVRQAEIHNRIDSELDLELDLELVCGVEPQTFSLRVRCSTN
jgi:hypothetical protein